MTFRSGTMSDAGVAGVLGVAAVAWVVVVREAEGMQSAPGTMGLGALGFLALWTVMMAAMMLPGLAPLGVLYTGEGAGRRARMSGLAGGYLASWALFGLVALVLSVAAGRLAGRHPSAASWVGAAVLIGAGAYQLSPWKDRCLTVCRSPLSILAHVGRYRGSLRHVRAGVYHGGFCVGCCWSLMVVLIAVGIMDLRWMVLLTVVVTLEKTWRYGPQVALAAGIALIILGLLVPWYPGIVPGVHSTPMPIGSM